MPIFLQSEGAFDGEAAFLIGFAHEGGVLRQLEESGNPILQFI